MNRRVELDRSKEAWSCIDWIFACARKRCKLPFLQGQCVTYDARLQTVSLFETGSNVSANFYAPCVALCHFCAIAAHL
eukprot:2916186-Pleurochrysis_carterae.AAC.1